MAAGRNRPDQTNEATNLAGTAVGSNSFLVFTFTFCVAYIWHSSWCSCMMVMVLLTFVLRVLGLVLPFSRDH